MYYIGPLARKLVPRTSFRVSLTSNQPTSRSFSVSILQPHFMKRANSPSTYTSVAKKSTKMTADDYDYEFFVVGGGSGGIAAANAAGKLGVKTAVADFVTPSPAGTTWGIGGTCLNVGCIPKKLFHHAAQHREHQEEAHSMGWEIAASHKWDDLVNNVDNYIRSQNWGTKSGLKTNNVKYYNAFATFNDAHTIKLTNKKGDEELVTARHILLCTGGRPNYGGYPGAEECCISSDDIFWHKQAPGKTLVIGAAYIALECAGFLTGLGFDTTVMVRSILLRGFDQEVAGRIGDYMEKTGTKFIKGATPEKFERLENGRIKVYSSAPGFPQEFDTVLMATGRFGLAGKLNLGAAGVKWNEKSGKIYANDMDQTNVPHIHVVGDLQDANLELTPVAIRAGKLLVQRLFNNAVVKMDYENVATTVFTPLEYGCIGLSIENAIEKHGESNVVAYHKIFKPLDWSLTSDRAEECYVRIVCLKNENEKIIGFHYLGPHAGEITQGYAVAVKVGFTKAQLDATVGIHPTNAEMFHKFNSGDVWIKGKQLSVDAGCAT